MTAPELSTAEAEKVAAFGFDRPEAAMTNTTPTPSDARRGRLLRIIEEARRVQAPEYPNASTDDEVVDALLAATRPADNTDTRAEFRFTDAEWREYQNMPEQGYSHRHWLEHVVNSRTSQVERFAPTPDDNRAALLQAWDSGYYSPEGAENPYEEQGR